MLRRLEQITGEALIEYGGPAVGGISAALQQLANDGLWACPAALHFFFFLSLRGAERRGNLEDLPRSDEIATPAAAGSQ